jgi:hypothetical protein
VRAPAPFARNAPGQTSHGKSGADIPGENGDLNHGVVIDLILHWPSWYAGPQAPPRQKDLIGRLDITLRGIAAICAILRRSEHAKKFTRVDAVLHSAPALSTFMAGLRPEHARARQCGKLITPHQRQESVRYRLPVGTMGVCAPGSVNPS